MVAPSSGIPVSEVVLLDTNVLIIYAREGEPARKLEALLGIQGGRIEAVISVVSVGEAIAFAKKNNWGERRQTMLHELIRTKMVPVDINRPEILTAYAEIDHHCEQVLKPAITLSKNDLWIAATARVLDCVLATTDRDFDRLHGHMLKRRWIDPTLLKANPAPPAANAS
jgi:tRNA(fMet)-specific endonuclease VapC